MYCIFARFCFVSVCFLLINFIVKIYIIVCKSDKNVAAIGCWYVVDPESERYHSLNPNNYCVNL